MCEVLTIGEPMVMFLADTKQPLSQVDHFTKMIAGAELNVAMGLSRLGHSVSYMTQVGEDPFGEYIKDFLKKEQIDKSYIKETNEWMHCGLPEMPYQKVLVNRGCRSF